MVELTLYEEKLSQVVGRIKDRQRQLVLDLIRYGKFGMADKVSAILCTLKELGNLISYLEMAGHIHTLEQQYAPCTEVVETPGTLPTIVFTPLTFFVGCADEEIKANIKTVFEENAPLQHFSLDVESLPAEGVFYTTTSGMVVYEPTVRAGMVYAASVSIKDIWGRSYTVPVTISVADCLPDCSVFTGQIIPTESGFTGQILSL